MEINIDIIDKLKNFIENEARSCSMDFGGVYAKYVQRMLGSADSLEDIEVMLEVAKEEWENGH